MSHRRVPTFNIKAGACLLGRTPAREPIPLHLPTVSSASRSWECVACEVQEAPVAGRRAEGGLVATFFRLGCRGLSDFRAIAGARRFGCHADMHVRPTATVFH